MIIRITNLMVKSILSAQNSFYLFPRSVIILKKYSKKYPAHDCCLFFLGNKGILPAFYYSLKKMPYYCCFLHLLEIQL